jgi:hypothetical protein
VKLAQWPFAVKVPLVAPIAAVDWLLAEAADEERESLVIQQSEGGVRLLVATNLGIWDCRFAEPTKGDNTSHLTPWRDVGIPTLEVAVIQGGHASDLRHEGAWRFALSKPEVESGGDGAVLREFFDVCREQISRR